jgi:nitrite reductase/ring-hydroxylating ferredoxin subunit
VDTETNAADELGGTTMERLFACLVDELPKGSSITLSVEDPIAVYHTDDGAYFATSDTCTHENWSLGTDGDLEGTEVMCPLHMARFDVVTGKALCFPASIALRTYHVEVDEGKVYVLV